MFIVYNYTIPMNNNTNKSNEVGNREKSYSVDSMSHSVDGDSRRSSRHSSFEICFTTEDTNNKIDVYETLKLEKTKNDNKFIPEEKYNNHIIKKRRKRDEKCQSIHAYSPPDMNEYLHKLMIYTNKHK